MGERKTRKEKGKWRGGESLRNISASVSEVAIKNLSLQTLCGFYLLCGRRAPGCSLPSKTVNKAKVEWTSRRLPLEVRAALSSRTLFLSVQHLYKYFCRL